VELGVGRVLRSGAAKGRERLLCAGYAGALCWRSCRPRKRVAGFYKAPLGGLELADALLAALLLGRCDRRCEVPETIERGTPDASVEDLRCRCKCQAISKNKRRLRTARQRRSPQQPRPSFPPGRLRAGLHVG
jgi:hypothetical protein